MHRVRMSLPYFSAFGWDAEVVTVDEKYSDVVKDNLLMQSIPANIKIHRVQAFDKKRTEVFGLGSLGLRSLWFYRQKVNQLLKTGKYDLMYFSTTQFPVCILGAYWKKRFGVPYVIDMQDPWYSDHYSNKPSHQRPPKYRLTYAMHKYLEAGAMKHVNGLISVSEGYINELKKRYLPIKDIPASTITFGAFEDDLKIAEKHQSAFDSLLNNGFINVVYAGRGGVDMHKAIRPLFEAFKQGLKKHPEFNRIKLYFIGTSYAPAGYGKPTILPLAKAYGIAENVIEITDRISYYHTLCTLLQADALFIPGSDGPDYSASKIYPYLLTKKPLLAIFDKGSNGFKILKESAENTTVLSIDEQAEQLTEVISYTFLNWSNRLFNPISLTPAFEKYSARNLTRQQTELFDLAIKHHGATN